MLSIKIESERLELLIDLTVAVLEIVKLHLDLEMVLLNELHRFLQLIVLGCLMHELVSQNFQRIISCFCFEFELNLLCGEF